MEFILANAEIKHNEKAHRFESENNGLLSVLVYKIVPGRMLFQHTEVPPSLEGRGLAAKLTRVALEYARKDDAKTSHLGSGPLLRPFGPEAAPNTTSTLCR